MTVPDKIFTRRWALAGSGALAGLASMGCASPGTAVPGGPVRAQPGTLLWRSRPFTDGEYGLGLVPAGGVICAGDGSGNIYGLNAATGATLWRRTFRDNSSGYLPLAAAGGRVFAVGSGRVAALSAATGGQLWSVPASGVEGFPPGPAAYFVVYAEGVVCVLGADGHVAGLDPRTGRRIWRSASAGSGPGAAAADGVLYVAGTDGRGGVAALDVRTGRPRWATPAPAVASTLVVLDSVIAGTPTASPGYDAGQLTFALDKATGRPLWRADFDVATYSRVAGEDDRVYVQVDLTSGPAASGTVIYAVAARSGRALWKRTFPSRYTGGMITAFGGRLYGGFREGILRALSPATGAQIWQRTTAALITGITSGPRVIYVNAAGPPDTIYAIRQ